MALTIRRHVVLLTALAFAAGCGGSDGEDAPAVTFSAGGQGGAAGSTAQAGSAGALSTGGASGAGGSTGVSGKGGAAGKAGSAGATGGAGGSSAGASGAGGKGGAATGGMTQTGGKGGSTNGGSGGSGGAAPQLDDVHISGRTEKVGATYQFGWSGVSFTTTFMGTGLSVSLEDGGSSNEFEVVVDGTAHPERTITVMSGTHVYPVIDALPAGEHTATVHRRTEGSVGVTTFHGFTVTGGAIVPSPSPFLHRIEVIGDSISCGYGTECKTANEAFSTKTENHWLTYGAVTGRNLSADVHTEAWSGKGLVENYGTDTSANMPSLFPRAFATAATPAWDFKTWDAEVVVIDLGTNDWNHSPPVDPMTFQTAYSAFADAIEGHYPGVVIFGVGNTLVGKTHTAAVKAAMSGKANRHYIEFGLQSGEGVCCQHPCAVTHARWGKELTAAIQGVMAW
jgi:hypothetical protein